MATHTAAPAVELRGVTLEYAITRQRSPTLPHAIAKRIASGTVFAAGNSMGATRVRALDAIDLTLREGDRLALVGGNGAGKSTLLRAIAGCLEPTCGTIEVRGRVNALLTIGAGMDPERSGRENIYTLGLHLLMLPREVAPLVDEIVDFAELGDFIDLPLRTYSDGMRVRLAFAVATSLKPEILLLDEGIGAGDARFADKARKRAGALYERARILIMASHSGALLRQFCDKALWLHGGRVMAHGDIDTVLDAYTEWGQNE